MIKINAARRLQAVRVVKDSYTKDSGDKELKRMGDAYAASPSEYTKLFAIGHMHVCRRKSPNGTDIVCFDGDRAVGTVHMTNKHIEYHATEDEPYAELMCWQPSTYIDPDYQRKGIVRSIYDWAITQRDFLSDDKQSAASHKVWKDLMKRHNVLIIVPDHEYRVQYVHAPDAKLTLAKTMMLVLKGT